MAGTPRLECAIDAPPSRSTMDLAIRGVRKTYPNGVRALHDITLDIPSGVVAGAITANSARPR